MNFFEAVCGVDVAAALIPFKTKVTPEGEDENAPKHITLESLVYRLDISPKKDENGEVTEGHDVALTVPADGIKKIIAVCKEKAPVVKEKAVAAKEKVSDKVTELREKHAAKKAAAASADDEMPEEEITIEVKPEDITADAAEETAAPAKKAKAKAKPAKA